MKQEPPFALQIEPVEGCTLACSFCALQSIRDNGADAEKGIHGALSAPFKFMEIHTAIKIADELQRLEWNARIEFAMHGEPTVHPKLDTIIRIFRRRLPKASLMVTTNGSGIMKDYQVEKLFAAGLNTLAIDNYRHAKFVRRMKPWMDKWAKEHRVECFRYPQNKKGNPHQRYDGQRIVVIADISDNTKGTHQITNQGANSGRPEPLKKRCAKPFRELSVRWDGNVAICCDDWRGTYKIGNVNEMKLDEIWNHPRYLAARQALYHSRRDMINVCSGCNVRTYRNGLLPDKLGKETLPLPDESTVREIAKAQAGKIFSIKLVP